MQPAPLGMPARTGGFAPRPVPLRQAGRVLQESAALVAAWPGRLVGLYLLIYLPVQLFSGSAYLAMPLRAVLASIGFAGIFGALEAIRGGRAPGLRDMAQAWQLPRDKLVLLGLAGLVPVLLVWLVWWLHLGSARLDALLTAPVAVAPEPSQDAAAGAMGVGNPPLGLKIETVAVDGLLSIPLLLLQPLCVLYSWNASRTFSANLLASLANWRWGLILAVVLFPLGLALYSYQPQGLLESLLLLLADVATGIYLSAMCLVLMHRTLD